MSRGGKIGWLPRIHNADERPSNSDLTLVRPPLNQHKQEAREQHPRPERATAALGDADPLHLRCADVERLKRIDARFVRIADVDADQA